MPKPTICSPTSDRRGTARAARLFVLCLGLALLAGCGDGGKWHAIDVSGSLPPLSFAMTRSDDGKPVTQADYRGRIVLLYFGYTNCPDVCPATLANVHDVLTRLGRDARQVRVLFVTVDPNRNSLAGAEAIRRAVRAADRRAARHAGRTGLARHDAIASAYSVTPAHDGHPYEVTHSAIVLCVRSGRQRRGCSISSMATPEAGDRRHGRRICGTLIAQHNPPGLLEKIERIGVIARGAGLWAFRAVNRELRRQRRSVVEERRATPARSHLAAIAAAGDMHIR